MAKRMSRYPSDRKVYVGDLGNNAKKNDLEYAFGAYGTLRSVWIARNPPGFAFVEFESSRDAADAVRGLDGRTVCGRRARVELSTGKTAGGGDRRGGGGERRGGGGGGGGPGGGMRDRPRRNNTDETKCYECGGRGHYARECRRRDGRRGSRRRSNSRSRSRSASRNHRTRSRTPVSASRSRSRSRSISANKNTRKSRDIGYNTNKIRENGRGAAENGSSYYRYSEDERNGAPTGVVSPIQKRRYDDSVSPSPRRNISKRSRRGDSALSRTSSRRD